MGTKRQNDYKKHLVIKRNDLNELGPIDMSLQQMRFVIIYLAMIDPNDESTRRVRFPLDDFQAIMEMGRLNIKQLSNNIDELLSKVTGTITETGGILRFQYFKRCLIDTDNRGEWYIEFDAHDDALPIFFNLKSRYFKYQLWNGLRLKSVNQLRFYEILKQHQWRGFRVIAVKDLKMMLGIDENEYPKFYDLKRYVINVCQKALSENTDIFFTYEPHGKKGRGGKVLELKFTISANKGHEDSLTLERFIEFKPESPIDSITNNTAHQAEFSEDNKNDSQITELSEIEHLANFESFWEAYPDHKKAGLLSAKDEWSKLPKDRELFCEIMNALERAKKSNKWTTDGGVYVHEPTNWLRQRRWCDNYKDTIDTRKKKSGKIHNYKGRNWDYEKLAQMEREHLNRTLAK